MRLKRELTQCSSGSFLLLRVTLTLTRRSTDHATCWDGFARYLRVVDSYLRSILVSEVIPRAKQPHLQAAKPEGPTNSNRKESKT